MRILRTALPICAVTGSLLLTGCSGSAGHASASSTASTTSGSTTAPRLTMTDGWAKASDKGMSAAFGTLTNPTGSPIVITGVTSDVSPVQLHTTVKTANGSEMKETKRFQVPAGGSLRLVPGGNHIMFMSLTKPLQLGSKVTVTLHFDGGHTQTLTLPVRAYQGAHESYAPGHSGPSATSMPGMAHSSASR